MTVAFETVVDGRRWDAALESAGDANVFQSFGWGEYKRGVGWRPSRQIGLAEDGRPVIMAQILVREFPGLNIGWVPGGPLIDFAKGPEVAGVLQQWLGSLGRQRPAFYLRLSCHQPRTDELSDAFGRALQPSARPIDAHFTAVLDLSQPPDQLMAGMSQKHRYNTKRALQAPVDWFVSSDEHAAKDLVGLYNEMAWHKGSRLRPLALSSITALASSLGASGGILVGRRAGGDPMAACLFARTGSRGHALIPATGVRGRAIGAGYALHYTLFRHLQALGVTELDLAGIDPRARFADVNRFKAGFGARTIEYLGEWEWARPPWLRVLSPIVSLRGGRL